MAAYTAGWNVYFCRFGVTCGLTACTPGSAPGPTLGIQYGTAFTLYRHLIARRLLIMAAQCSRCGHYIFALWFLLLIQSSSLFLA